ncbi:hypothetical protein ACFOOK_31505 [Micromonospora krabiensis]
MKLVVVNCATQLIPRGPSLGEFRASDYDVEDNSAVHAIDLPVRW